MKKPTILIVDDEQLNIGLLKQMLEEKYIIRIALNGEEALKRSLIEPIPDLILLDVVMPAMDGYETCRQLKSNPETNEIPILFITVNTEPDGIVKGFESGAVDYIVKPFQSEELEARVKTHLKLKLSLDKIQKQKKELLEAAEIRDDVDCIIQHDLKTPLNAILGFSQIFLEDETLSDQEQMYLKHIVEAGSHMLDMINLSQDLFNMERGVYQLQAVPIDIFTVLENVLKEVEGIRRKDDIKTDVSESPETDENKIMIMGEKVLFHNMLANVIKNAIEASPVGGNITIDIGKKESTFLRVHNEQAVPENMHNRFFEKYATSGKRKGTGLGTYSAKLIAEALNGQISMNTSVDNGTTILIEFPNI